ncbi:glycine-rich protein [Cohnella fermenti]|uniref:glycine-rich protein n=1 Tax=Cohnella fermenti TaxID=2565925 RepID=UPI001454C83C|nr:glycine-rich protein [Cohnella fermenti]
MWSQYVTYIKKTSTHVTYVVDIPYATSIAEFCWHANNAVTQTFEYETISKLGDRALVAGGGGGSSHNSNGLGGYGGGANGGTGSSSGATGAGGTQTAGYLLGFGAPAPAHGGGGGGGYYGGKAGAAYSPDHSGGGGGSGYIGGVTSGSTIAGNASMPSPDGATETGHSGNGVIIITAPAADTGAEYITNTILIPQSAEPPPEAYIYTPIAYDPTSEVKIPGGGTYKPGNFVNLDYGFQLYFPNIGDFYGNGAQGIARTSEIEGKGFTNAMSTTEWTKAKSVQFQFIVIYNNHTYLPNEWIDLDVSREYFDFYVPLAASEYASALVQFKSIAINGTDDQNDAPLNKTRYTNQAARHSALKRYNVDVVGNIGNMVIEDTGDFRFSNFFKQAVTPTQWLVKGVVKKVDPTKQNNIMGDTYDLHGRTASTSTQFLNTFGLLPHLQQLPVELPLSPEKNNIDALKRQPMRMGYNVLADIQTTGNYYDSLQILPYYYRLDLKTGTFTPVDVYMNISGSYKVINKFGAAVSGWDSSSVYPYVYALNWEDEKARRNYSAGEQEATDSAIALAASQFSLDTTGVGKTAGPSGSSYRYGTAQVMSLTGRNRTFIGNDETYGESKNPDMRLSAAMFNIQAQRWHFTYGLPSSAVAVKSGEPITQANINAYRTNTSVIVMAANIKSIGDVWALDYKMSGGNNPIQIAGTSYSTSSIPYPVISVFSINKSSADDLEVSGTH